MVEAALGSPIDIHGGGHDLIFPHHENEIAQSVCAKAGPGHEHPVYARYWMHNGFLTMDSEKMSKSLGNVLLVHDLVQQVPGEAIRSTLCIPIFAERPEEDAPAGARPPAVGCLQLFNRVPRGVAWNADRSTYDGPVEFHSRDLAQARSFCEKLSPAISAGQRVQQRLDAEEAVRAAEKARRLEELQRRKAYVEQQNASFVAHKERAGGHGDERAGGHGDELVNGHGHVHKHGRHDGRGHGPSPPSSPSVAAAASSPSVPAPVPVAAAPSSSGPATATAQRPAQPKASPNVDTKPVAAAQRTAAAPPPALPTPPPTPPRKSKFDTLKTTPRKSLKKKKKPETQG
jgi:hypothetical protein